MDELNGLTCKNCGGHIDRRTMKCPYCDTQYGRSSSSEFVPIEPRVENGQPIEYLYLSAKVDLDMFLKDQTRARRIVEENLTKQLAKTILKKVQFEVIDDPCGFFKIYKGTIGVCKPSWEE